MKKIYYNSIVVFCVLVFQFQFAFGQDCPQNIIFTQNHTSSSEVWAEQGIESGKSVNSNVSIVYKAGNIITLTDNFHAKPNCDFRAFNGEVTCNGESISNGEDTCDRVPHTVSTNEFDTHILRFEPPVQGDNIISYIILDTTTGVETPKSITWESVVTHNVSSGTADNYIVYINQNGCNPPGSNENSNTCNQANNIATVPIQSFTMMHHQNDFISQPLPDSGNEEKRYYFEFEATLAGTITATSAVRIGIGFKVNGQYNEDRIDIAHENVRNIEIVIPPGSTEVKFFAWRPSDPIPSANINNNPNVVATVTNLCLSELTDAGNQTGTCTNTLIENYIFGSTANNDQWRTLVADVALQPGNNYQLTVEANLTSGGTAEVGLKTTEMVDGVWFNEFVVIDNNTNSTPLSVNFTATQNLNEADLYVKKYIGNSVLEVGNVCLTDLTDAGNNGNLTTLKDYPTPLLEPCGMYIGAAATTLYPDAQPGKANYINTFKNNFNLIVPEIGMKMDKLKPFEGSIQATNGELAKEMQGLANKTDNPSNNMLVRGHTLCWHGSDNDDAPRGSHNPDYLNSKTNAELETELSGYIREVILEMESRFNMESWDVVNEAFRGIDPDHNTRSAEYRSPFRTAEAYSPSDAQDNITYQNGISCVWEKLGNSNISFFMDGENHFIPKYVVSAFQEAANHTNKPLVYNDWGAEFDNTYGKKSMYQFKMIEALKNAGIRIDGVGFQCHFTMMANKENKITTQQINNFKTVIERYTIRWPDIKIYLTEVDITLPDNATDNDRLEQARFYKELASMAASIPQTEAFVTWGVYDQASWLQNFESHIREPLLFTKDGDEFERKGTYNEVLNALNEANCNDGFSKINGGFNDDSASIFTVYPNPFQQTLQIDFKDADGEVSIYDMTGRAILHQKLNGAQTVLTTKAILSGCYIIEVKSKDKVERQKIVKH